MKKLAFVLLSFWGATFVCETYDECLESANKAPGYEGKAAFSLQAIAYKLGGDEETPIFYGSQEDFLRIKKANAAEGTATYYTVASCKREGTSGVFTANGEAYDESAFTCALRRRDFGKQYMVVNLDNGKSVAVRQNDFGPGKKPTARGTIIDLTPAAFLALGGQFKEGKINVGVQEIVE